MRLDDASGISSVLPVDIAGSLSRYYRHVVDLFLERDIHAAVVSFATLALDAAADEGDDDVDELWAIQFTGNVDLGLYEDAYVSLMAVPSHKTCVFSPRFPFRTGADADWAEQQTRVP